MRGAAFGVICILAVLSALPFAPARSQERSLDQRNLRSFHPLSSQGPLRLDTDAQAFALVERVFAVYGLRIDPEVYEVYVTNGGRGETATASAIYKAGRRYIIFNRVFMEKMRGQTRTDWALIAIAAHEVQHHLRLHVEGPNVNRPLAELEADYFAGFTLGKMGAPHDETTASIRALPDTLGVNYPPRAKRIAELSRGWDAGSNGGQADPPRQIGPTIDIANLQVRYATRQNRDIYGADIAIIAGRAGIVGQTIESCARLCDAIGACRAFSYDRWKAVCYLKGEVLTSLLEPSSTIAVKKPAALPDVSTGVSATIQVVRNKIFRDEPYNTLAVNDFEHCKSTCDTELRCVAFSYIKTTKQCRLLNFSEGHFTDEAADSGYKRQPPQL